MVPSDTDPFFCFFFRRYNFIVWLSWPSQPNQSIIWHYNPLWIFAFSVRSLQVLLSLFVCFQFLTFNFFRYFMTSSCHRCLGLPIGLVPIGFQSNSFLVGLPWFLGFYTAYEWGRLTTFRNSSSVRFSKIKWTSIIIIVNDWMSDVTN